MSAAFTDGPLAARPASEGRSREEGTERLVAEVAMDRKMSRAGGLSKHTDDDRRRRGAFLSVSTGCSRDDDGPRE